jgi:hypothetical protein
MPYAYVKFIAYCRTQFVEILHLDHKSSSSKSFNSSLKVIRHGVPQSSVLLFINNLPHVLLHAKIVLFADDTNILLTENTLGSLNEKVVKVTEQLENRFNENQLIINMDKTKVLFFHGRGPTPMYRPVICLKNRELIYSSTIKFLGINLSDNLSWTNHTQIVCLKLNKALYLIKSLRVSVSLQVLTNVYFTKFESILKYGTHYILGWRV